MGYQESVIKVKKTYQNELIEQIINSDREQYIFCDPCLIVEVKKDISRYNFEKDDKLLYVCGERDGQRSFECFIDNSDNQIKLDANIENRIYPIEDIQDLSLFNIISEMDNGCGEDEYFKVTGIDKYIENQKEKSINKYDEVKNRHQKRVNDFPLGFAFSNEQFKDMMEKWGLEENDTDKILSIGGGGFIRKTDLEEYNKMWDEIRKENKELIESDKTGDGYIKDMFVSELENHEYCITYDIEDTLDALELSYEQVMSSPNLKHGLELAKKEIIEKENEQDYDIE